MRDEWRRAVREGRVLVLESRHKWTALEDGGAWKALREWADESESTDTWTRAYDGVPTHVRVGGAKTRVRVAYPLAMCAYNVLAAAPSGDRDEVSVFEAGLIASPGYQTWRARRANVSRAMCGTHVVACCEVTAHTLRDVADDTGLTVVAFAPKRGQADGSAVLIDERRVRVEGPPRVFSLGGVQVGLACSLYDKSQRASFVVVALHLKSDGADAHGSHETLRVAQADVVHRLLSRVSVPVMVMGDLNSDAYLHATMTAQGQRHVLDVFADFRSVLPLAPTYHHHHQAAFDYILLRGRVNAWSTHVPTTTTVCPNRTQGSDHLPVYAHVVLQSTNGSHDAGF